MIISHKHKFIFMHNQKTAGSSICAALNPYLGPNDVHVGAWQDTIQYGGKFNWRTKKILMKRAPRMLASSIKQTLLARRPVSMFTLDRFNDEIKKEYAAQGLVPPGHTLAINARKYDEKAWAEYFKFVVVRNPWDHAVSYYYWLLKSKNSSNNQVSFNEFLRRMNDRDRPDPESVRPGRRSAWGIYAIDNQIAVNYVVRFEHLTDDLKAVSAKIGIPIKLNMKAKSSSRDKGKELAEHYDDECMALVSEIYKPEIEHFGYKPPF